MTHPLFGKEIFVETAYACRFQAMLRSALHKGSWHVIVADPGSGIEAKRFLDGGTLLVECPDCAAIRSLEPRRGVLRFPSHDKRKTRTPMTSQQWAMEKTIWKVVGGESK